MIRLRSVWRAHAAFLLAAFFFSYGFIHRVAPSVMVPELMREFSVGAAALGNFAALYFWAYAGLQIPVGVMLDRLGPRRLIAFAAASAGIGSIVFGVSGSLGEAAVGRLLIGVGAAFSWVGCLTVATHMFAPRRFPLLAGIAQTCGVAGAVFGQVPLAIAINNHGWRETSVGLGVAGMLLAAGFWFVAQDRKGIAEGSLGVISGLRVVARNPQTWFCAIFSMSLTAPIQAFSGLWGVPYVQAAYGLDKTDAGQVTSFVFYGWIIGALGVGLIMDRVGRRRPLATVGSLIATGTFGLSIFIPNLPVPLVSALLLAHGLAASVMLTGFVVAREQNPSEAAGSAYGLVNAQVVGIGAVMQIIIGTILDLMWDGAIGDGTRMYSADMFRAAFASLTVLGIAGFLAATRLQEPRSR